MYWNDSSSNIDLLFAQETPVSLEAILKEDDVLQQCIGQNNVLLTFLTADNQITEMITMMISEPTETTNDMERFKNANTVCEILTFDGTTFVDPIVNNDKHLSHLWSFVSTRIKSQENEISETESSSNEVDSLEAVPLNPLLASFFTKVFLHLFIQSEKVLTFLASQQAPNDFVSVILRHINTSAIMDLVLKSWQIVNVDKNFSIEAINRYNDLLYNNGFVEKMIDIFKDEAADLKQQNVAQLISDLTYSGREILIFHDKESIVRILQEFENVEFSRALLKNMFDTQSKYSIASGLHIIQTLLVYRIQAQQLINQQNEQLTSMANGKSDDVNLEGMPKCLTAGVGGISPPKDVQFMPPQLSSPVDLHGEHLAKCVRNVCAALQERLDDFVRLLTNPPYMMPVCTTVGVIKCPLGLIRLEVIHLFVALFATSDYSILEKCSQLHILKLLTDLFFEYSLNNQLHKYYEQIVEYLFQNYTNFKVIFEKVTSEKLFLKNDGPSCSSSNNNNNNNDDEQESTGSEAATKVEADENISSNLDDAKDSPTHGNNTDANQPRPNNDKILYFTKLYEMSKVLVRQIIVDCRLIEKILDSFADQQVPQKRKNVTKDSEKAPPPQQQQQEPQQNTSESVGSTSAIASDSSETVESSAVNPSEGENVEVSVTDGGEKNLPPDQSDEPENVTVEKEEKINEEVVEEKCSTESVDRISRLKTLRPSYMGHLRLIANVLRNHCSDELLLDCGIDSDTLRQWNEFKDEKLMQFNELLSTKLVEESNENSDQVLFNKYQIELISTDLAATTDLLPTDFGQNSLGDINEQLNLMSTPDFDFDKYWKRTEDGNDFEFIKYFNEKCSSIFDDDDDDVAGEANTDFPDSGIGPLGNAIKKPEPNPFLIKTLKEDFAPFDDPFSNTVGNLKDSGFANFDQMNSPNPWGDKSESIDDSLLEDEQQQQIAPANWSADFSNDPFVSPSANSENEDAPPETTANIISDASTTTVAAVADPVDNSEIVSADAADDVASSAANDELNDISANFSPTPANISSPKKDDHQQ